MSETAIENEPGTNDPPAIVAPRAARPHRKSAAKSQARTAASNVETQGETIFGAIPGKATHWSIERELPGGQSQKQQHPNEERTAYLQEWPIADLSEETVRDRWGGGRFRVRWHGLSALGQRVHIGQGRLVTIIEAPAAAPSSPLRPEKEDDLSRTFTLMRLFDERSNASLANVLQAAGAIAGTNRGMDPQMMQLMMQNQQQQFAQLIAEMRASSDRQIAELRAEIATQGVRSARPVSPPIAPAAASAIAGAAKDALFKPGEPVGEQLKASFMNYAVENPNEVVNLIKTVPQILEAVAKVIQPPPPPAVARSRRTIDVAPVHEAPPDVAMPPIQPGLNGFASQRPKEVEGQPAGTVTP